MSLHKRYKAINFDLDTECLRKLFGESGRRKAYSDIGHFLMKNGFEHRQGSGYRSFDAMTTARIIDVVVGLYSKLKWLSNCVQKLDVTNIGTEYDMHLIAKRRIESEAIKNTDIFSDVAL
jgi:cell filamentation protein